MENSTIYQLISNGKFYLSNCKSRKELYEFLNSELLSDDEITDDFLSALEEREKRFPTGIETSPYNIGLPHVDAEYVKTDGLIIVVLQNPIEFYRMDDVKKAIQVKVVFLLLIKTLDLHVKAISGLTKIWTNHELMNELLKVKTKEELLALIANSHIE